MADDYLQSHFAFICYFHKSVIAYEMKPSQKAELVKIVKKRFPYNPVIMAVGDGANDVLMMEKAHISIEV